MKKCPNCGADLPDEVVFCSGCGTQVAAVSSVSKSAMPEQPSVNPVISIIKQNGKSSVFLVALIAYGYSVLFSLSSAIVSCVSWMMRPDASIFFSGSSSDSANLNLILNLYNGYLLIKVIIYLVSVFIFIGMLRFYLQCRQGGLYVNAGSLKWIHIPYLINYILLIVGLSFGVLGAFNLFLSVAGLSASDAFSDSWYSVRLYLSLYYDLDLSGSEFVSFMIFITVIMLVVLGIALVFELIYGQKVLHCVKSITAAVVAGERPESVSRFVIIFNYILAGIQVFALVQLNLLEKNAVAGIAALIAISVAMQKYNTDVRIFCNSNNI